MHGVELVTVTFAGFMLCWWSMSIPAGAVKACKVSCNWQLGCGSSGNIQSNRPLSHIITITFTTTTSIILLLILILTLTTMQKWLSIRPSDPRCFKKPAMPAEPSRCAMLVLAAPSTTLDPVLEDHAVGLRKIPGDLRVISWA